MAQFTASTSLRVHSVTEGQFRMLMRLRGVHDKRDVTRRWKKYATYIKQREREKLERELSI